MSHMTHWIIRDSRLDLALSHVMGVLNITPDSFSDGGQYNDPHRAAHRAGIMVHEGAALLDVGAESTRPGAQRIDAPEQIRRAIPVIRAIRESGIGVPISIDTTLTEVAEAAIDAGANIINDVAAGTESHSMLELAARTGAGLILMHRLREPGADFYSNAYPTAPHYGGGVVHTVRHFLQQRRDEAVRAGVDHASIMLDPGLGFGKSVQQNLQLIAETESLLELGCPLLSAASRKSFVGAIAGEDRPDHRVAGSIAVTLAHAARGVKVFRVHDVGAHVQALRVAEAVRDAQGPAPRSTE